MAHSWACGHDRRATCRAQLLDAVCGRLAQLDAAAVVEALAGAGTPARSLLVSIATLQ